MEPNDIADRTRIREAQEDAHELITQVISRMWREGTLNSMVLPRVAIVDPTGTTVIMTDGSVLTIPHNAPDRARLEK